MRTQQILQFLGADFRAQRSHAVTRFNGRIVIAQSLLVAVFQARTVLDQGRRFFGAYRARLCSNIGGKPRAIAGIGL